MLKSSRVPIVGALAGLSALLGIVCGSDAAEPVQFIFAVRASTPQPQVDPPATPAPTPIIETSLSERLEVMSVMQPTRPADAGVLASTPIPTAKPLPDAESVVGSGVPTPPTDPEVQPDPPERGTPLINITLPRAASEEVVNLATFDSDKNIVIVFYRAFW
jgi:hypothetical protein